MAMYTNLSPGAIGIRGLDLEQSLDLAKDAGYGGLQVNLGAVQKLAEEKSIDHVKELWSKRGLRMGGSGLPVNMRGSDAEYYESLSRLPAIAKFAAEIGVDGFTTVIRGWDDQMPFKENWDFHVKRLRLAGEIMADYGHSIGLEFIGPRTSRASHKYGFVYTMDGMLGLAAAAGTGNIGLLLDFWHWYTCRATLDDLRHLSREDIVHVHINDAPAGIDPDDQIDNVRALPGETGVIPLVEIVKIVDQLGYDGPVTPEPFSQKLREMTPMEAARTVSDMLKRIWQEAGLA